MNSLPPLDVRALLRKHGLRPDKRLGQNFLEDQFALTEIAAASGASPRDSVLEIGAGLGSLTRHLAVRAARVAAVELDARLLPALREVVAPYPNVQVVEGDILKIPPSDLIQETGYLVAANIPYYITSAIIRHLLEHEPRPRRVVLTIQKEVAQRICAAPGKLSLLALSVQVYGEPRIVAGIPAAAFYPAPEVDSAILVIEVLPSPRIPPEHLEGFFRLTKAGFAQKRKTLRNSLAAGLHISTTVSEELLREAGIDPRRRAETLDFSEWGTLCRLWVAR